MDIIKQIAEELQIKTSQAETAVRLIDEGNTIPFIARYRKEATGALNDEVLRNLYERLNYLRNLEEKKEQVLAKMKEDCLVAVVRAKNLEQGEKVVDAIIAGGINFIEITMTMDEGNPVEFIAKMSEKYRDNKDVVIGAGTVLDSETARAVILAGANYVVSPGLNVETIKMCNRYRVPMLPGVMTPTEAITALEAGCDIIKIFPGNIMGPAAISSFKGPLPQGEFMPSGGVDVDNVDKWIKAGAYAVGTGSSLTKGAKTGDFAAVTAKAQEFVKAVAAARA